MGNLVAKELRSVPGVEAAFLSREGTRVFVVVREHGSIDREALIAIEDQLTPKVGAISLELRASQGRDPDEMFRGLEKKIL